MHIENVMESLEHQDGAVEMLTYVMNKAEKMT